jgi:ribosome-binding factor A
MAREFKRTDRIADQIQRDLAELIRSSIKDPRVGMVTVNDVVVAKDLGFADVYVTLLTINENNAQSDEVQQTVKVLNGASGFLRSELGRMIKLRMIPQLRFHYDASVGEGRRLDGLINKARAKDASLSPESQDNTQGDSEE